MVLFGMEYNGIELMKLSSEKGSVLVELVLAMPILFVMTMAVLQFAHIWIARQVVHYAAYSSARSTLTSRSGRLAHGKALDSARSACAWVTFSNGDNQGEELEVAGWGKIPNSGAVNERVRVTTGYEDYYNLYFPWESRVTVEFDFPLLMPVVGRMVSYLHKQDSDTVAEKLASGEVGFKVGSGWTGQQEVAGDSKSEEGALPFITIRESCILPKPYSTDNYPLHW